MIKHEWQQIGGIWTLYSAVPFSRKEEMKPVFLKSVSSQIGASSCVSWYRSLVTHKFPLFPLRQSPGSPSNVLVHTYQPNDPLPQSHTREGFVDGTEGCSSTHSLLAESKVLFSWHSSPCHTYLVPTGYPNPGGISCIPFGDAQRRQILFNETEGPACHPIGWSPILVLTAG